jgi:hypothetical protein
LFGDYSKKLKKWAIFVFADYASMIGNDIYFCSVSIDSTECIHNEAPERRFSRGDEYVDAGVDANSVFAISRYL